MNAKKFDALDELDAALAAAVHTAKAALATVTAVAAQLYPGAKYLTVAVNNGVVTISETLTADWNPYVLPARDGQTMLPWLVGDRPLAQLPEEAHPHLGRHAKDTKRTLNSILTDCWRAGLRFPVSTVRRHKTVRLTLR